MLFWFLNPRLKQNEHISSFTRDKILHGSWSISAAFSKGFQPPETKKVLDSCKIND